MDLVNPQYSLIDVEFDFNPRTKQSELLAKSNISISESLLLVIKHCPSADSTKKKK